MPDASPLFFLQNRCPRCRKGRLFVGLVKMNAACPSCGLAFEREAGQNWGAMVLSYAFGGMIAFPLCFALLMNRAPIFVAVAVPTLVLAVIAPFSVRFSRLIWTHVMYSLHPPQGGP